MTIPTAAVRELHARTHECLDLVVNHMARLPEDMLLKEVTGFGWSTLREQLVHVLSAEMAWVQGLQLLPIVRLNAADYSTIDDLREAKRKAMAATIAYLDSISEDQFNRNLERYPAEWMGPQQTPAFILLHIITHAFHHKGQMVAMLRLLGYPAPETDLQAE